MPLSKHLAGLGNPRQPRQPLRPACARNNAELHFRLANLRTRSSHAVVAGHCQLQASAERHTVNGHNHRLRAIFDLPQQREQAGSAILLPRSYLAKLLDIRAGDKCPTGTDEYSSLDTFVLDNFLHSLPNSFLPPPPSTITL